VDALIGISSSRRLEIVMLVMLLTLMAAVSVFADEVKTKAAQDAAESWLALVDSEKYGESWEEAASMFKGIVPKEKWESMSRSVRGPLGELKSRELASAEYTTEMPGAPDGEYVVIQYKSSFENKRSAVETVAPMLDKDGKWRVSGYFIR
jgi:hypothetical protein